MNAASQSDEFIVTSPVWTIIVPSIFQKEGLPGGVAIMEVPKGAPIIPGLVFPLFTDEALAKRFVEESGKPDRSTHRIEKAKTVLDLLEAMKLIGVRYVGFDCPADPNPRKEAGRYPSLQQVIAAVRLRQ